MQEEARVGQMVTAHSVARPSTTSVARALAPI